LSRDRDLKRRSPDLSKAGGPGSFPLPSDGKQQGLELALQNRLEAIAKIAGKGDRQVAFANGQIRQALDSEQVKLAPSLGTQLRTKREFRDWRLGKDRNWKGEAVEYGPRIDPDWAARLVRHSFLRQLRRYSEERAIEGSAGVTVKDLNAIERRAFEIVVGKRGVTRSDRNDRAVLLANAVLKDWLPREPDFRLVPPEDAPSLTIQKIVHLVVPFLDELAGKPIGHSNPYKKENYPAKMNPPALGALVAIARMAHPEAGIGHIRNAIRSFRNLNLITSGHCKS
jgi:hypothetical protein